MEAPFGCSGPDVPGRECYEDERQNERGAEEAGRSADDARYFHALNYCMLLPGPEAQQLATYVGWLMHGVRGGLAAMHQ